MVGYRGGFLGVESMFAATGVVFGAIREVI